MIVVRAEGAAIVIVKRFLEMFSSAVEAFLLQVAHDELVYLPWIHSRSLDSKLSLAEFFLLSLSLSRIA